MTAAASTASSTPASKAGGRGVALLRDLYRHDRAVVVAGGTIIVLVVLTLLGPLFLQDPTAQSLGEALEPPLSVGADGTRYLLGTDALGRDILSRAVSGLAVSLTLPSLGIVIGAAVGITVGAIGAYFGGLLDDVVARLTDIQLSLPGILVVLFFAAIAPSGRLTLSCVLALVAWVIFAKVTRGQIIVLREQDMIMAMRSLGGSHWHIITRHVLPNIAGPLLVVATLEMSRLVIAEAALGYLGLGLPPPTPSLGVMIADGQQTMAAGMWWPVVVPAVLITVLVLAVNVIGDWGRDRLDPRQRLRPGVRRAFAPTGDPAAIDDDREQGERTP